jgi:aspartyl-tRNA(Asn)/glutamyl-tRNA(Gln) amidotransferase subunit A
VKEIIAVEGRETTANSKVTLPDEWRWPKTDAAVVARLKQAGVTIGSATTSHEFAWGITTAQPDRYRATNPLDPTRVAGGSSGGAASSVGSGRAWAAVGTDTGGSVRIPAAWCGLVGWKPSSGLIAMDGVLPLAPSLDHVGFLARTVEDIAALASWWGVDPIEPTGPYRVASVDIGGVADHASRTAVSAARAALKGHAIGVGERLDPISDDVVRSYTGVQLAEALMVHTSLFGTWPTQRSEYSIDVRARLEVADRLTPLQQIQARRIRESLRSRVGQWFFDVDVVLLPTTGCFPPALDDPDVVIVDGERRSLREVVMPHTAIANLLGLPAVTIPWRTGSDRGIPTAVQLLAAPGRDAAVLAVAQLLAQLDNREEK